MSKAPSITLSESDTASHLVALIINQDHVTQGWVKFWFTIEAALAVGLGFILKIGAERVGILEQRFLPWAIGLIPAIGILSTVILCMIIVRERKWTAWYVQQVKSPDETKEIFPNAEGAIASIHFGFLSWAIIAIGSVIGLAWFGVLLALIS